MKQGESGTKIYIYDNSGAWHQSCHKKIDRPDACPTHRRRRSCCCCS